MLAASASAQSHWKAHPSAGEEFTNSAVVFVGKVTSARAVPEPGDYIRGTFYTMQVTETLKGSPLKTVEVYSENSSGRFPMEAGDSYLIFAYVGVFEGIEGRHFAIDNSGNSGKLEQSKKALAIVRKLRNAAQ